MSYGCPYFAFSEYRRNITVNRKSCIGCAACVRTCPRAVLSLNKESGRAYVKNADRCASCFMCLSACPISAISVSEGERK